MSRRARWLALLLAVPPLAGLAQNEVLTEWVQVNPLFEGNKIALGYPVPVPVDSPLPFEGFRTYMGLHTRHQDLAATTPWVHPEVIGATRAGRTLWAYRLGDEDRTTPWGLPEPATLTNGGIHAREWQTPETVTGILELLATAESDGHIYDYLREQVNMVVIPVLNIDGFLQTQRTPSLNWLGTDPDFPDTWPRDGRMRRKNMLNADEDLMTLGDHLGGVDLNRNNRPYWNTTGGERSSDNPNSLVHHGANPASEPEIEALHAAADLGPLAQLRLYTDVHSFSQVHFWVRTMNDRLARQTEDVLGIFTGHHLGFEERKWYAFAGRDSVPLNQGIGTTDEYFTVQHQVPSWTLEVEPTNGQSFHAPLPGSGADYGGEAVNGHDGFILPESQIKRVREELAQSFAAVYYRQSGPPHVQALRFVDQLTGAVVYEAEWDVVDDLNRELFVNPIQPLVLGRKYTLWLAFSKPMRWLVDGEVTNFPGQLSDILDVDADILQGNRPVDVVLDNVGWAMTPGGAPDGYLRYKTDTLWAEFSVQDSQNNRDNYDGEDETHLRLRTWDITGMGLDADPSTVVYWAEGHWNQYEDSLGTPTDFGGRDGTLSFGVTDEILPDPWVAEPGTASAWFDPAHNGEGFLIEMLSGERAVLYWFTYDDEGNQDWLIGVGEVRGNRLVFPQLLRFTGGVFGEDFDPAAVTSEAVGSARFIWSGCDTGHMDWHIGNRRGRQSLQRLTRILGMQCGAPRAQPLPENAQLSGSWYDPTHSGEGFVLEMLDDGSSMVFWFSYGPDGARRWYFGVGGMEDGKLVFEDMLTSRGGIFGDDFDPGAVEFPDWGTLELAIDCAGGTASYDSSEEGFGAGVLNVVQLTQMDGLECDG